jgi:hypothetical protein
MISNKFLKLTLEELKHGNLDPFFFLSCPTLREKFLDPCNGFLKEVMIAPRAERFPAHRIQTISQAFLLKTLSFIYLPEHHSTLRRAQHSGTFQNGENLTFEDVLPTDRAAS